MKTLTCLVIFFLSTSSFANKAKNGLFAWRDSPDKHFLLLSSINPNYPPSPYQAGMTPAQFLQFYIRGLEPHVEHYIRAKSLTGHIDQVLTLPLQGVPHGFAAEVLKLVFQGLWTSPAGVQYNFRLIPVYFPLESLTGHQPREVLDAYQAFVKGGPFALRANSVGAAIGTGCKSFL